jgi:uncharacterized integral membrane protein
MRLRRKLDPDHVEQWQPKLWAVLIGLVLAVTYVVAFVVENSTNVPVHWVFGTTHGSLIWVIVVSLAIGILVGVLLSQLYRRRRRRRYSAAQQVPEGGGEPPDTVSDLGR